MSDEGVERDYFDLDYEEEYAPDRTYDVFESYDYLIIPVEKKTKRPVSDYTNPILRRCSSATDVFVGVTQFCREQDHSRIGDHFFDLALKQFPDKWGRAGYGVTSGSAYPGNEVKVNSGFPYYNIKASDVAFILGSQDEVDFYLIDKPVNGREPCVVSWVLPKLK